MSEFFGPLWFETILQQQVMSAVGTLISINSQKDAYEAKARQYELEIADAQRQLDLQNKIFESRLGKMK